MQLKAWDESADTDASLAVMNHLAKAHALNGGAVGSLIGDAIDRCDYDTLARMELDYSLDWDVFQLIECRQALGFYQKFENLNLGIDREQVAFGKFQASELACRETNAFFRSWYQGDVCPLPVMVTRLERARRLVHHLLGRCPAISELRLAFGPGATTSIRRKDACPTAKFAAGLQCSRSLYTSGLLPSLLRELPHWTCNLQVDSTWSVDDEGWLCETVSVDLHPGNLSFVPKNALTDRSILVEPTLNTLLQGGIGRWIKNRLRIAGIDISDQSRNARLAHEGSVTGELATLDLSSASDLVSTELVKYLLPEGWYRLLKAARTETACWKRHKISLEKFSSMGNGYTFPLETLIFWAVTRATCEGASDDSIGVYGDDIICPSHWAEAVISTLGFCGFKINTTKSFVRGPFRESCGKDYYRGIDVRPYYQRKLISGETLFTLHNFYYRHKNWAMADVVRTLIPRHLRLYGPDGYGDGHLLADAYRNTVTPKMRAMGWSGVRFDTFAKVPRRKLSRYPGDYVSPLYSVYVKDRPSIHPLIDWFSTDVTTSAPVGVSDEGIPLWGLPGDNGYKRISIYTLG